MTIVTVPKWILAMENPVDLQINLLIEEASGAVLFTVLTPMAVTTVLPVVEVWYDVWLNNVRWNFTLLIVLLRIFMMK